MKNFQLSPKQTQATESIQQERNQTRFDIGKMMFALHHRDQKWINARNDVFLMLSRDCSIVKKDFFNLNSTENRALTMKQLKRYIEIRNMLKKDGELMVRALSRITAILDRSLGMRLYVHFSLFKETLWSLGTPELQKEFMDDIEIGKVLGCFAMTELGTSSQLTQLETTAVYDRDHDEFVLTTPSLTGTKWWIGMAGQTATHTLVLAQLDVDGKNYGVHWFCVPLRDRNTGELLPGVSAGHLGEKAGRSGLDNGWIQLTRCRIPRKYMLQKFMEVRSDGTVHPKGNPVMSYVTLIGERIMAIPGFTSHVSQAIVIACRYGVARRQGASNEKIMDYPTHFYRLMPILSSTIVLSHVGEFCIESWEQKQKKGMIEANEEFYRDISEYHGLAACLKSVFGYLGTIQLETIRRTMGGHGFSAYSAIPGLIADYGVITQGGGDNIVLAQQATRSLIQQLRYVLTGQKHKSKIAPTNLYLVDAFAKQHENWKIEKPNDFFNPKLLSEMIGWLSFYLLQKVGMKLASSKDKQHTWNENMVEIVKASEPHAYLYSFTEFQKYLDVESDPACKEALQKCNNLFLLSYLENELVYFLSAKKLSSQQAEMLRQAHLLLCKDLRHDAIGLTDAFYIPDFVIKSPLGRYDGNIYENYFNMVSSNPGSQEKAPYWDEYVKPLVSRL